FHSLCLEPRYRCRTGQEFEQVSCDLRRGGICAHRATPPDIGLNLVWYRSDKLHPRRGHDLCNDNHPELNLTVGHELGDNVSLWPQDFRLDGVQNSEPLEQTMQIGAARPVLLQIADRFGIQQG